MLRDEVIGVGIGEVEAWACTPVTEKPTLDVILLKLLGEEGVASKEDLAISQRMVADLRVHQDTP